MTARRLLDPRTLLTHVFHGRPRVIPDTGGFVVRNPLAAVALRFEPRDVWLGVYWDDSHRPLYVVYVCLLPMLVLRVSWFGKAARR